MVDEQRRYNWMDRKERPPLYDYVQQRIKEKALEDKYMGLILTEEENEEVREARFRTQEMEEMKPHKQTLNQ